MRKAKYLTFALALAGALSACGGGGGGGGDKGIKPSGAGLDVTEFLGTWKNPIQACYQEPSSWAGGQYYSNGAGQLVANANSFERKVIYFSDTTCESKAGAVTTLGTVQWSVGSSTGRSNVVRAEFLSTGVKLSADGDGKGMSLGGLPPTGKVEKYLLDVVDGKLCSGFDPQTADSDGYPTVINSASCSSR